MKSRLALSVVVAFAAAVALFPGYCSATAITFDELPFAEPGDGIVIPTSYAGLGWNNFYYLDGLNTVFTGSGYPNAVVSPNNVGYNGFGAPASFTSADLISFNSFYITAAWNNGLNVDIQGRRNGAVFYQAHLLVDTNSPTLINLNWLGVDEVDFQSYGGVPRGSGPGTHFVLDNLIVDSYELPPAPVPLGPSTWPNVILGLAGVGFIVYRRKSKPALITA